MLKGEIQFCFLAFLTLEFVDIIERQDRNVSEDSWLQPVALKSTTLNLSVGPMVRRSKRTNPL